MSDSPDDDRGVVGVVADGFEHAGQMLDLAVGSFARLMTFRHARRRTRRLVEQLYVHAVKSLLVVAVVALFTGMVLALQTGAELRGFGAEVQLPKIVAAAMAREMGPFITAIILAATAGAAVAAELGTMRVSEEVDALEMMNVDVVSYLVAPRVISMGFACLLLTIFVDVVGVFGGALVANAQYGTLYSDFFAGARETLASEKLFGFVSKALYSGLVKAWFFGVLIGAMACAAGLRARGGALGVGRAVRTAVTASVVLTLIVGYLITWFFWA